MKIFILEDTAYRLRIFGDNLPNDTLSRATSLPEAVRYFEPPYDLLCLDHDLSTEDYSKASRKYKMSQEEIAMNGGSGTQFVRWLLRTLPNPLCPVIVHSFNYHGRRRMVAELDKAGWEAYDQPFGPGAFELIERLRKRIELAPEKEGQDPANTGLNSAQNGDPK